MSNNKEKSNKPQIKVYLRDEDEVKIFKEHAEKKGYSASAWLRGLGIKDIGKGGKNNERN